LLRFCSMVFCQLKNLERLAKPHPALANLTTYEEAVLESMKASIKRAGSWSRWTLALVAASVLLILAAAFRAIVLNTDASVGATVVGLVTTVISSVLFVGWRGAAAEANKSRNDLVNQLKEKRERLYPGAQNEKGANKG